VAPLAWDFLNIGLPMLRKSNKLYVEKLKPNQHFPGIEMGPEVRSSSGPRSEPMDAASRISILRIYTIV
jgi:hypothetical protein